MSMSCFRLAPKVGHIERMKRIYGYLSRTKHYALRFRTEEPNYMHLPELEYDWTRIYGNVLEEIPKDAPEPLGQSVTTTTFLDANLLHDLITGRSVTAVLKCEAVNCPKFELAGIPVKPFKYLDTSILIIAHAPCMHVHDVHAYHDVTRFAYDVNHVTMMSPAFTFHSCHVERRWHDIIGVCVVGTPHHHGLHHMGMT